MSQESVFALAVGLSAFLYSMVGHGGASGYLAAGALLGMGSGELRVQVLCLNLLVSGLAAWSFWRGGHLRLTMLLPLAAASVPAAYIAARIPLDPGVARRLVGCILALSALRLILPQPQMKKKASEPAPGILLSVGGILGLLAGFTGVGGGIYLSPVLVLTGWCSLKEAAAVSALFIWLNSASAISSLVLAGEKISIPWSWMALGLAGGLLGSHLGAKGLGNMGLRWVLAVVLAVASAKLIFS